MIGIGMSLNCHFYCKPFMIVIEQFCINSTVIIIVLSLLLNYRFDTRRFYHFFVLEPSKCTLPSNHQKTKKLFRTRTLKTANHAATQQQLNASCDRKRDSKCARNH